MESLFYKRGCPGCVCLFGAKSGDLILTGSWVGLADWASAACLPASMPLPPCLPASLPFLPFCLPLVRQAGSPVRGSTANQQMYFSSLPFASPLCLSPPRRPFVPSRAIQLFSPTTPSLCRGLIGAIGVMCATFQFRSFA